MKKLLYAILIGMIIIGGIMVLAKGFEVDTFYHKNVRIEIYLGKQFDDKEMKQLAQDALQTNNVLVQKVELFGDMVAITVNEKDISNLNEKLEALNTKINEKYELQNNVEDILITHQPKAKLSSILKPYIAPAILATIFVLGYNVIRYRKLGILKVFARTFLPIALLEAVFASIVAIFQIPVGRYTLPIALFIYAAAVLAVTFQQEKELEAWKYEQEK